MFFTGTMTPITTSIAQSSTQIIKLIPTEISLVSIAITFFSSPVLGWPGMSHKPKAPLKGRMSCNSSIKEIKAFAANY